MNLKGVSTQTWVRIIAMIVILVNLVSVTFFNYQLVPFSDEQIYEGVAVMLTVVVVPWASWKNNSFTRNAQTADSFLKNLNREDK